MSKRVKQQLLVVEDGQVHSAVPHTMPVLRSDAIRIPGMETETRNVQDKQLAADGYM